MAELKRGVLGRVTGSIGSITGRIKKGKNYLAARPASFIPGKDSASIERRIRFKLAVKFGVAIVQQSIDLKYAWQKVSPYPLSAYNFIVQTNYRFMDESGLTPLNTITPDNGFPVSISILEENSSLISVSVDPLGNSGLFDLELEKKVRLFLLIYNENPSSPGFDPYTFQLFESTDQNLQLTNELTFSISLNPVQLAQFNRYSVHQYYAALLTFDSDSNPVKHSITVNR